MKRKNRRGRVHPLLNLACEWVSDLVYPYRIRVPMMNGKVIPYQVEFAMVAPHIFPDGWETTDGKVIGYQYKSAARDCNHEQQIEKR